MQFQYHCHRSYAIVSAAERRYNEGMSNPKSLLHPRVYAALQSANITYEALPCDPNLADTAAFCQAYGYSIDESANTIVVTSKGEHRTNAACLVLANSKLDVNREVCKQLQVKKASFASMEDTIALTDMEVGGITIIGMPNIPILIDAAVMKQSRIIIGGGNRTSKILINPAECSKLPHVVIVENLAQPKS